VTRPNAQRGAPRPETRSYPDREIARFVLGLNAMPSGDARDEASARLALGLGAGPRDCELSTLLGTGVEQVDDFVLVHITAGPSPRTVPVHREWQRAVLDAAERAGSAPLLRPNPPKETRVLASARRPTMSRLRVTWMVRHLRAGVPLFVLASAAGCYPEYLSRLYLTHPPAAQRSRFPQGGQS
jgi:hypothetical protein